MIQAKKSAIQWQQDVLITQQSTFKSTLVYKCYDATGIDCISCYAQDSIAIVKIKTDTRKHKTMRQSL
jgi:hypothetical protein